MPGLGHCVLLTFGCHLTTPHKLRPEARSRKRAGRRPGVCHPHKPTAEAVTLHAVVRLHLYPIGQEVAEVFRRQRRPASGRPLGGPKLRDPVRGGAERSK